MTMGVQTLRKTSVTILALLISAGFCMAQAAKKGEPRWESNLSLGYISYSEVQDPPAGYVDDMTRHLAIVKSFWFFPFLPRVVALGLSFDYVIDDLPLSLNVALNLPAKFFVPFVSAGAGFSFSGNTLSNYGGGLKLRTGRRFGLIFEYRHYKIKKNVIAYGAYETGSHVIRESNYFGFGIAYLY